MGWGWSRLSNISTMCAPRPEIAALLRRAEIDIAVDLKGYTGRASRKSGAGARPCRRGLSSEILEPWVRRRSIICCGPRGDPGRPLVTLRREGRVAAGRLLDPTDRDRRIAARTPSRAQPMLPETGFIFCCFNDDYKIPPEMFEIWMRLLQGGGGGVLADPGKPPQPCEICKSGCSGRGSQRLVFARGAPSWTNISRGIGRPICSWIHCPITPIRPRGTCGRGCRF